MSEIIIMGLVYLVLIVTVIAFLLLIRMGSFPFATCMLDGRIKKDIKQFTERLIHTSDQSPIKKVSN